MGDHVVVVEVVVVKVGVVVGGGVVGWGWGVGGGGGGGSMKEATLGTAGCVCGWAMSGEMVEGWGRSTAERLAGNGALFLP